MRAGPRLRDPVVQRVAHRDSSDEQYTQRDRRIHVATRDRTKHVGQREQGKTKRQRGRDDGRASWFAIAVTVATTK